VRRWAKKKIRKGVGGQGEEVYGGIRGLVMCLGHGGVLGDEH